MNYIIKSQIIDTILLRYTYTPVNVNISPVTQLLLEPLPLSA